MITVKRPTDNEFGSNFKHYIEQVKENNLLLALNEGGKEVLALLESIDESKWDFRYEEGKWSIKELILHLIDTERIMAYRALRVSRNDKTSIPGFDQDTFVEFSNASTRTKTDLITEYKTVRLASTSFFLSMNDEALARLGTAGEQPISARALGFIIAGHEIHHINILKERYLSD